MKIERIIKEGTNQLWRLNPREHVHSIDTLKTDVLLSRERET